RAVLFCLRRLAHSLRRIQRQRVGGDDRSGGANAGDLGDAVAGKLRFQIPKRAVDCVSRGAGRQDGQQPVARQLIRDKSADGGNLAENRADALAVAGVRDAFAPPRNLPFRDLHNYNFVSGFSAAADAEAAFYGPAFRARSKRALAHGRLSTMRAVPSRNGSTVGRPSLFSTLA